MAVLILKFIPSSFLLLLYITEAIGSDNKLAQNSREQPVIVNNADWISLNVGGKVFTTTKKTLSSRDKKSSLAELANKPTERNHRDLSGAYLIDRDPDYFSAVLTYLRRGKLALGNNLTVEGLREEAEYFKLRGLVKLCDEQTNKAKTEWISLNVGGKVFTTTRTTLSIREKGSFLDKIAQLNNGNNNQMTSATDPSGAYLLDRDPDYFAVVLNYLRHGEVVLNNNLSIEGLRKEAEFLMLPGLIQLCDEQISGTEDQQIDSTQKQASRSVVKILYDWENSFSQFKTRELEEHINNGWQIAGFSIAKSSGWYCVWTLVKAQ